MRSELVVGKDPLVMSQEIDGMFATLFGVPFEHDGVNALGQASQDQSIRHGETFHVMRIGNANITLNPSNWIEGRGRSPIACLRKISGRGVTGCGNPKNKQSDQGGGGGEQRGAALRQGEQLHG